ncbi:hypothetical protein OG216_47080 (plasmid) [Streptomycetaceae bacterium NBC_01309]
MPSTKCTLAAFGLAVPLAILPMQAAGADTARADVAIGGLAETIKYNAAPDEFTVTVKNPTGDPIDGRVLLSVNVEAGNDVGDEGAKFEYFDTAAQAWKPVAAVDFGGHHLIGGWAGGTTQLAPGQSLEIKARFGYSTPAKGWVNVTRNAVQARFVDADLTTDPLGRNPLGLALGWFMPDAVALKITGFPESLVAGGPGATFEAHLTSSPAMTFPFSHFNSVPSSPEFTAPSSCDALLQVFNPKTKAWTTIDGSINYQVQLADYGTGTPEDRVLTYRIALGKNAKPVKVILGVETTGPATLLTTEGTVKPATAPAGTKVNDCAAFTDAAQPSPPATGGSATPSGTPAPRPPAGEGPELAETGGSDSDMTLYGVAGAAVLAAGAGTLLLAKRRRAGQ